MTDHILTEQSGVQSGEMSTADVRLKAKLVIIYSEQVSQNQKRQELGYRNFDSPTTNLECWHLTASDFIGRWISMANAAINEAAV